MCADNDGIIRTVSEGMLELATMGIEQARQGVTSIEEVYYKLTG